MSSFEKSVCPNCDDQLVLPDSDVGFSGPIPGICPSCSETWAVGPDGLASVKYGSFFEPVWLAGDDCRACGKLFTFNLHSVPTKDPLVFSMEGPVYSTYKLCPECYVDRLVRLKRPLETLETAVAAVRILRG